MHPPIEISFTWDERHYVAAVRAYLRSRGNRLGKVLVLLFGAYLVGAAIWMVSRTWDAWPLASAYLLLAAAMFAARGPLFTLWVRRRYRRRPDRGARVRYLFDDAGVRGETDGRPTSEIAWDRVVRALVDGDSLLLFVTPQQYVYVPLGAEREALCELVRAKLGARAA